MESLTWKVTDSEVSLKLTGGIWEIRWHHLFNMMKSIIRFWSETLKQMLTQLYYQTPVPVTNMFLQNLYNLVNLIWCSIINITLSANLSYFSVHFIRIYSLKLSNSYSCTKKDKTLIVILNKFSRYIHVENVKPTRFSKGNENTFLIRFFLMINVGH